MTARGKLWILPALLLSLATPAQAQFTGGQDAGTVVAICGTLPTAYVSNTVRALTLDVNGNLCITGAVTTTPSGTQDINLKQVQGAAPSATNPIWVSPATASTPWAISGASGAFAAGSYASGAFASGAVASGAYASGSLASGAVVDLTNLSTPITPATATAIKAALLGLQYNSTQATFTNGQQGSVQGSSRGALYVATGADAFTVTGTGGTFPVTQSTSPWVVSNGGTFAVQAAITAASGSIASGAFSSGSIASGAFASGSIASGAFAAGAIADGADVTLGAKADARSTATDTTSVTVMQVLKEISFMEQTPASRAVTNAGTFAVQATLPATPLIASGNGVIAAPTSVNTGATTRASSGSAGSNLVLKASAGNLYDITINIGATSGYIMLFDATSLPSNGAVTPVLCEPVNSNGTNGGASFAWPMPFPFATGITAGFSTTGCFTLTASTTAAFFGGYK